ncbi:unnamed protein product, partial [Amoebophrya sp. A120]
REAARPACRGNVAGLGIKAEDGDGPALKSLTANSMRRAPPELIVDIGGTHRGPGFSVSPV